MTAHTPRPRRAFEDVIRARTEANFVERAWLYDEIEQALKSDEGQYVLVTGEPGAGKTSLLAGIARAHPDRLRYFFRRDSRTAVTGGDTESFLLSIGHQLARERPELFELERLSVVVQQHIDSVAAEGRVIGIRIDDLKVSPFHRTATLEVEQRIRDVAGRATGVEIGMAHLEPRLLDSDNLAHLALIGPAQVLAEQDPEARIVILLDALDEIADDDTTEPRKRVLHWLARSPELPANVKVVMTSRPHAGLRLFRAAREDRLTEVVIDAGSPQVVGDLRTYADCVLERPAVLAAERARGSLPGSTKRHAVRRAAGNFLYLATYARALIDAAEEQDDEMVDRLLAFSGVPGRLPGLYGFFVELVREELTPWPRVPGTSEPGGWEGVGLPIIGVLTVAREALTEDQLTALSGTPVPEEPAQKVLSSLRWLLDRRSDRIAFFHTSVNEFLAGQEAREKHPECWVDETRWHERIAHHYRGTAPNWGDLDWLQVDHYGLAHLVAHVLKAGPRLSAEAVDMVCPGLRSAVRREFGAERRFLELVDSVAHHVADGATIATGLPAMTYLGVVRHQAAQSSNALPPRAIGLLARMGRVKEALEHAIGITPSLWQVTAFAEILQYAHPGTDTPSTDELLDLLVESALTVPTDSYPLSPNVDADRAIEVTARLLASHDLDRALRLWRWGQERSPRSGRLAQEPDALYRLAAAAEQDVDRAHTLIRKISAERWGDYLDAAERADPAGAVQLLREAEKSLESAGPADRVLALARLAATWAAHDPDTSRRFLAEVRVQLFAAGREEGLAAQLVRAACVLEDVDRITARLVLARLDTCSPDHWVALDGARLWVRWGVPERARSLVAPYLAATQDDGTRFAAMKAIGQSSPAEALRLLERDHAAIPGPSEDPDAHITFSLDRDHDLTRVVERMAEYDLARATQMARGITATTWRDDWWWRDHAATAVPAQELFGEDRYSLLAGIAHLHLAQGQSGPATTILEEVLGSAKHPAPLRGGGGYGRYFMTSSSESNERSSWNRVAQLNIDGMLAQFNMSHDWAARARGHFHRHPADVVRAVELGAHSSMARVVRRFAGRLARRDLSRAGALIRSLADPGERAIGFAELHRMAHGPGGTAPHTPEADMFSREIDRALSELPRYRWTSALGDDTEDKAWAYARPDHRVRFELALLALGCRKEDWRAIEGLPYLARARVNAAALWVSEVYATDVMDNRRPLQGAREIHMRNLSPGRDLVRDDTMAKIVLAAAAYHEYRIAREVPGYSFHAPQVRLDDPVYAAAVDLVTPVPGAPLSPAFTRRLREMLDEGPLPAAAGLLAFAGEARQENRHELRELAAAVIARARDGSATGLDTLAILAESPLLGDLVDPVALLHEAERCEFAWAGETWIPHDVVARLFPVLLERAPAVAMRTFYEVTSSDWPFAMSMLEHAPDVLIGTLDTDAVAVLGAAIAQGLACTSPEGVAPDVVDGVRLVRLAGGPGDGRQAA
ncbi:ATP-binding protein [Streptomyces hyaluromycini]|uniref:ATP-binding protein n=1 Tax=Streptomyces hyaluromycini TaxID=1377993 RepID=UPI000B5C3E8F|nr:ATP-binding protein [Streptomyces hyaluromycini]